MEQVFSRGSPNVYKTKADRLETRTGKIENKITEFTNPTIRSNID
jgi:hypothetical protein